MNQSNYNQFNYDHYEQAPMQKGPLERVVGPGLASKLKNPIFATGALLFAGAAFAGILMVSYSGGGDKDAVPIVQAEAIPFKVQPSERGGMDIPNQDSTVFSSLRDPEIREPAPVENLLADEEPVDRLEAFAAQAERIIQENEAQRDVQSTESLIEEATGVDAKEVASIEASAGDTPNVQRIKQDVEVIKPEDLMQKVEAEPVPEKPEALHKPGASPETLAFVKDVLDKKDGKSVTAKVETPAETVAAIKPAAGFAASAGTHYIQLGSVKTEAGAASEWGKLQKKYPVELQNMDYRVERADLGERGVFYRIQAGPISGESASEICGSIKAQSPGACLVTK